MSAGHAASIQHYGHLIAFSDIWRSRNDLNGFCPDIHLANDQFVRIGMSLYLLNPADHDPIQIFIQPFIALDLGSAQSHGIAVLLIRAGKTGHICFNPG